MEVLFRLGGLSVALAIIFQASMINSEELPPLNDHNITMTEEELAFMNKCLKAVELKSINDMTDEKLGCFEKCLLSSSGMLNQFDKPDKENVLKDYEREGIPQDVKNWCTKDIRKCFDVYGEKVILDEPDCKSYRPLAKCMFETLDDICYTV